MRTIPRLCGLVVSSLLFTPTIFAQTNPPPTDPHEPVTHQPKIISKAAERNAAIDLLERARENYNLHGVSTPFALKIAFTSNGTVGNEGEGTIDEDFNGAQYRWMAQMGDSLTLRIVDDGRAWGTNPDQPVPLRVQMVRAALIWPITRRPGSAEFREGKVNYNGQELTCLLLSGSVPPNPAPRSWVEREYCVEPYTALLRVWSEAPGIYALYDYEGATPFHGHTLPKQISIYEEGRLVVQAHVESIDDVKEFDPNLFKPTPEMVDMGGSYLLGFPDRFPMRVDPSDAPTSPIFQPVIVHATLDAQDGHVLEAEALQNTYPDLSRAALDIVRNSSFDASGMQRDVYINVQFHMPATETGGAAVYNSPVHWVIWDHRGKLPGEKRPKAGSWTY